MKGLLKLFHYLLLLIVIVNSLYFYAFAAELEKILSFPSTPSPEIIKAAETMNSVPLTPDPSNLVTGDTGLITDLTPQTTIPNAISQVSGFTGASLGKALGLIVEGAGIASVIPNNFIPFYNLVDGSIVGFDLDKDEKVSVSQFKNGKFLNEFQSTLSKGSKLRQMFKDSDAVVTFEATDDASFFARKDNNYEFENGILTFRNNELTEKITTKEKAKAVIDNSYGVLKIIMPKDSNYSYESIRYQESNFLIENKNKKDYILTIRKIESHTKEDNYIDLVNHKIELNELVNLKKKVKNDFKFVYESLNNKNRIIIELDNQNSILKSLYL